MKLRSTGSSAPAMVHWVRRTPGEAMPLGHDRKLLFWEGFLGEPFGAGHLAAFALALAGLLLATWPERGRAAA